MTLLCTAAVSPQLADGLPVANVNDFVVAFGMVEAVELSNLDSSGSAIDCDRLNKALYDAWLELTSAKLLLAPAFAAVIDANINRWMLVLARYYLDTVRRRSDVADDYKAVQNKLAELSDKGGLPNGSAAGQQFSVQASFGKSPVWTEASLSSFNSNTSGV